MSASAIPRFDQIPFTDLSPESEWRRLGAGSFGCVYKGEYLGLEVAIKEVLPSSDYDVNKYFQRECKIMAEARHPNIVQYLGLCLAPAAPPSNIFPGRAPDTRQRILIISEYLPRGNLGDYITGDLPFPFRLRISFAIDIARALAYLHARDCMHRDLKGENLLCAENERIKVCDFGFARLAAKNNEEMRRMSYCGTDGYMSPEILMGEEFGLPTDIFSLGVIFCELLSRCRADNRHFTRQLPSFGIDAAEVRSLASPHCPPAFLELALSCLAIEPSARPTILSILTTLRAIEAQVLEAEARGVGVEGQQRGTWNVGSVSFAGTSKRGGSKRPSAPRLPSFEGQVKVVGSSVLRDHKGIRHNRQDSASSESEDEAALLQLAEVEVSVEGDKRVGRSGKQSVEGLLEDDVGGRGSHYSTAVLGRHQRGHQNIEDQSFASSTLTVRAFAAESGSVVGHQRLASSASSLPSIPSAWLSHSELVESASAQDNTATPTSDKDGDFPVDVQSDSGMSYLTARTTTLSVAGATISHGSDDDSSDDEATKEERKDVFHSTILPPADQDAVEIPVPTLHRFSLIKPSFARLLGSLAPYGASSSAVQHSASGSSSSLASAESSDKSSKRKSGSATPGLAGIKCEVCLKRIPVLKPSLCCDDCGMSCHIKCSDNVELGCPAVDNVILLAPTSPSSAPTRPLPPTPSASSNSARPSKLKKKAGGK